MEFIQILDADIRPGGLVEWVPSVPGGLGSWHRDPRPTSHNHEQHLRAALEYRERTRRAGGRESWLGLTAEFDEPMSVPAVRATVIAWINRHEVLRTHVVVDDTTEPDGTVRTGTARYTTDPGTVKVTMSRIGWYAQTPILVEQIAGSFDRVTAPLHWPAYRFATVARADSFTLLFAADHSLVDGYSLVTAHHELRELYRAHRDRRAPELRSTGSYIDFSGSERVAADDADERHTAVAVWDEFLAGGGLPRFEPIPAPVPAELSPASERGPAQLSITSMLLDDDATRSFESVCTARGGSLIGGLLALLAIVYRHQSGAETMRTVMPRHTRQHARLHTALGWFVGLAPISIDVADDPDFATALDRAMLALDRTRSGASLPLVRLSQLLGFSPEPRFVVSFMDTRMVPASDIADDGGARALRSHSYADDEVYIWFNRTPTGLRLHCRYPGDAPGHAHSPVLQAFFQEFAALLASTPAVG